MLRFATISDKDKGKARVKFSDDGIVSAWLPILSTNSGDNKEVVPVDLNEQVVCLMDENNEHGVILGAIYNKKAPVPAEAGPDKWIKKFKDGTVIKYDRGAAHEYEVTNGPLTFKMNRTGGFEISKSGESVKLIFNDLITAITAGCSGPGGGPIVVPPFTAIQTRLNNLFSA
jgi:phage baseplate assembly protein V